MATYYVRTDGNDANTGLGSATNLAWKTFQKALGATGATGGDIVYIAPGHYNEAVTIGGSYSSELQIVGDPTSSQFTGISSGYVKISQFAQPYNLAKNNTRLITGTQNLLHFKNIYFDGANDGYIAVISISGSNIKFTNCAFINNLRATAGVVADVILGINSVFTRCVIFGFYNFNTGSGSTHKDNLYLCMNGGSLYLTGTGHTVSNCTFIGNLVGIQMPNTASGGAIYNSLFISNGTGFFNGGVSVHANNRYIGNTANVTNAWVLTDGGGNVTNGTVGIDLGYGLINNITSGMFFGSLQDSQNINTGNTIASLPTDIYGTTWFGVNPDIGAITYRPTFSIGQYNPTERNSSAITIAPGSTSQSIELYLGATGLTASTSGLSARYNRTRTASVDIPLVARTIAQAWTAGGFAEVDSTNMPGVYRLDLPDAALAAGADDVTIVVRGASGTNGAVMTVKLSSGGLTEAQTASAVWGASPAPYNDATTMGGILTETNALAISLDSQVGDIPLQVWDEPLSSHTTAGTTGQRLNANVLADELLARDIGSGSSAGAINERTVRSALRGLRNKTTVINSEMTVYKEDDASTAWSATVSSSDSSKTITGVDPS